MKLTTSFGIVAVISLLSAAASAQTSTTNFNFTVNQAVPDNSATGLALSENLNVAGGSISKVTLSLDVSGGFNGDLYAYLAGPNGGFSVLLNRPGVGTGNTFGFADTGFAVTFDDSAASNVHFYQSGSYTLGGSGQLTGTWRPDGENIDPQSTPSAFDPQSSTAMLNSFIGANPNGAWTLFLSDLSPGGQSTVQSWGLTISTVPEPSAFALAALGFAGAIFVMRHRAPMK